MARNMSAVLLCLMSVILVTQCKAVRSPGDEISPEREIDEIDALRQQAKQNGGQSEHSELSSEPLGGDPSSFRYEVHRVPHVPYQLMKEQWRGLQGLAPRYRPEPPRPAAPLPDMPPQRGAAPAPAAAHALPERPDTLVEDPAQILLEQDPYLIQKEEEEERGNKAIDEIPVMGGSQLDDQEPYDLDIRGGIENEAAAASANDVYKFSEARPDDKHAGAEEEYFAQRPKVLPSPAPDSVLKDTDGEEIDLDSAKSDPEQKEEEEEGGEVHPHPTPAPLRQGEEDALLRDPSARHAINSMADMYFLAVVVGCSVAGLVGLIVAGVCWYRLQKNVKAASDVDYPAYGVTGPTKDRVTSPGDRKLAQSAQMYHYQHQKQQMIAMEKAQTDLNKAGSEEDTDEENEEGDYTVFECPGLAPTGEMEVKNPLFNEDTPVTPSAGDDTHK